MLNAPIDQADLLAGYKRASSIKPVKVEDITKVLGEYGLKQGASKGQTDAVLQARAGTAVADWYKKQQQAAPKPVTAPVAPKSPAAPASKTTTPATGSANPAKPKPTETAPTTTPAVTAPKPSSGSASSYMAGPAYPAAAVAAAVKAAQPKVPPKPAQVNAALTAAGLGTSKPPSYALVSIEALNAWIARVKANRALMSQTGLRTATRAGL